MDLKGIRMLNGESCATARMVEGVDSRVATTRTTKVITDETGRTGRRLNTRMFNTRTFNTRTFNTRTSYTSTSSTFKTGFAALLLTILVGLAQPVTISNAWAQSSVPFDLIGDQTPVSLAGQLPAHDPTVGVVALPPTKSRSPSRPVAMACSRRCR
jgi:hypothetical protein